MDAWLRRALNKPAVSVWSIWRRSTGELRGAAPRSMFPPLR